MWDVSLHIDHGRDAGPFANPSHYFILAGLYGIVAGGYLSTVLVKPGERPGRSALRIAPNWELPLGGALIVAAGSFALFGFPLDDLWHRLFGQDVTLWGPTHLIMLSGGLLTLVGVALLFEEGVRVSGERRKGGVAVAGGNGDRANGAGARVPTPLARLADLVPAVPLWPTRALIAGGFLAGLTIYQGEFDYGVPQFELVLQPLMIAGSAALALVAARIWLGRGGALAAVAFYLVIRGAVWLIVGPILGEIHPAMALYLPEAICVELVALALPRRPLALGAAAGLAAGTIGFAGEWPWVNAVYAIHWNSGLLPEGPVIAAIAGVAGGVIGALFGLALRRELPERDETGRGWRRAPASVPALAVGSLVAVMGCFAFGLADRTPQGASAQVTLTQVKGPPQRQVLATVRFDPPNVTDGASWVREIAWQGGRLVGAPLRAAWERRLPHPPAAPRLRRLEGGAADRERPYPARRADLRARRPGDPPPRRGRAAELHPAARDRSPAAPARAQARHPGLALAGRLAERARPGPRLPDRARGGARPLLARAAPGSAGRAKATDAGSGRPERGECLMARYEIEGKVVLITGAAKGIGLDTARRLAERGASLALLDLDAEGRRARRRRARRRLPSPSSPTSPSATRSPPRSPRSASASAASTSPSPTPGSAARRSPRRWSPTRSSSG